MMTLRITQRQVGDVTILDLEGVIIDGSVDNTIRRFLDEGRTKFLINMERVGYINSTGIGALVVAFTTVTAKHGVMKMTTLQKRTKDLLQITKLYTVFETFDSEDAALLSFQPGLWHTYCSCPVCGRQNGPLNEGNGESNICRGCEAVFCSGSVAHNSTEVPIIRTRIRSYLDEYVEVLEGPPFMVRVVGRLTQFTTVALHKAWRAVPKPRRVVFDLTRTSDTDEGGRGALLVLFSANDNETDKKATAFIEGVASQPTDFPMHPPFYDKESAALAALGDVSDTPKWRVQGEIRQNAG
jgi:anti-sigma B factor antagonist